MRMGVTNLSSLIFGRNSSQAQAPVLFKFRTLGIGKTKIRYLLDFFRGLNWNMKEKGSAHEKKAKNKIFEIEFCKEWAQQI